MEKVEAAPQTMATGKGKHSRRAWLVWVAAAVIVGLLLLPLLHHGAAPQTPGGRPGAGTSVTATKVVSGSSNVYLDAIGTVTPVGTVNVYSQVSGRVLSVKYREGQIVTKGQVLAEIDPRPTQAQLDQLLGTTAKDRAMLEQARVDLERYRAALKDHAIADQTVFDEQATVKQYEGTVRADEAQVRYYQVQLSYCRIIAPLSGRIGLRLVDPGNTIFSGSSSTIATITQENPMTVVFSLAEDHLPKVRQQLSAQGHAGITVLLFDRAQQKQIATGKLLTLDNQVDTTTGTVKYRAQFNNKDGALFPNQFVNARLQVDTLRNAKLIPTVAIQYNGQQAFVYVVQPNRAVALRNVTVLNSEGESSAVDGVNAGDEVVTSNFDRLTDGAKVSTGGSSAAPASLGQAL